MVPVEESMFRPFGSVGETVQLVTAPPLEVGVNGFIVASIAKESELGLYVIDDGAISLTCMVTVVVPLPPLLTAVTV
tara:strand:- start:144 stop:374 length:231 start_codon:yes stop_codon:yes gene_type:complete